MTTCEFRGWTLFTPGVWSSKTWPTREYGPDFTAAMGANFWRFLDFLRPVLKLGHDSDQRLARSMGFPCVGWLVGPVLLPGGRLVATAKGVPLEVGAAANAGWLRAGSAEISHDMLLGGIDREGPILTAMTIHGENHVSLDLETRLPLAVFADGSPVPPATSMAKWLTAMVALSAKNQTDPEPTR